MATKNMAQSVEKPKKHHRCSGINKKGLQCGLVGKNVKFCKPGGTDIERCDHHQDQVLEEEYEESIETESSREDNQPSVAEEAVNEWDHEDPGSEEQEIAGDENEVEESTNDEDQGGSNMTDSDTSDIVIPIGQSLRSRLSRNKSSTPSTHRTYRNNSAPSASKASTPPRSALKPESIRASTETLKRSPERAVRFAQQLSKMDRSSERHLLGEGLTDARIHHFEQTVGSKKKLQTLLAPSASRLASTTPIAALTEAAISNLERHDVVDTTINRLVGVVEHHGSRIDDLTLRMNDMELITKENEKERDAFRKLFCK